MLIASREPIMSSTSSLTRFLSIRDKRRPQSKPSLDIVNLFSPEEKQKKLSKEEEKKVNDLTQRLAAYGLRDVPQQRIEYALRSRSAQGDPKEAFKLLMLYEDSVNGVLKSFDPMTKLQGAENRERTTCYLDSLLFAMFAKPDVFEAILFNNFADEPRKRLIVVMRLWVNLLRTGRLVTTDITARLQESLAECGWADAAKIRQQDVSEAFAFITDKLELPLLTLKTDIYHSGKEDVKDDHKFITERMLDVAIPEGVAQGVTLTLEMCLEEYFNNRVDVKRHLQRRGTVDSLSQRRNSMDKTGAVHVESVELDSRGTSPAPKERSPKSEMLQRPLHMRARATSLFSDRKVPTLNSLDKSAAHEDRPSVGRPRASSTRKEVLMPAWQFLNLIPWYADNAVPETADQVRQHFSTKRPMLGICLKRYAVTPKGTSRRLSTHVDIPLEMACPHFDTVDGEGSQPPTANFKLSLQSVVCHRGHSVEAGHYVSLVRTNRQISAVKNSQDVNGGQHSENPEKREDEWLLFDDLAHERVRRVDIDKALKEESPYLLFYRVQPINDDGMSSEAPPPYEHSEESFELVDEKLSHIYSPSNVSIDRGRDSIDDWPSRRGSVEATSPEDGRGRSSVSSLRRSSIQWQVPQCTTVNGSARADQSSTEPTTPLDEARSNPGSTTLSRTSTRPNGKSSGDGSSLEKRFGASMAKITSRLSKEKPGSPEIVVEDVTNEIPPIAQMSPPRASTEQSPASTTRSKSHKERRRMFNPVSRRGSGNKSVTGKTPDRDCLVM